jgi:hypothetical protein
MKQFYKLTAFIVLLSTTSFNALNAQCNWWVKSFGGAFADNINDMKSDNAGNIYVCGSFSGTISLDTYTLTSAGDKDVFVAKLNSTGTVLWAKQGGGVYEDQATALALDASGNVYVGGKYSTSATFNGNTINNASSFLLNYTTSGTFGWVKNIASASTIDDITLNGDFLYLTGNMNGGNIFESIKLGTDYYYSSYLAKYTIDGKINSAIGLKFGSYRSKKMTIDNSSNISILTEFSGKNYLNQDTISSIGGDDLIVLNYSPSLTLNWYKTGGGSGYDYAKDITTDASGNVYILGTVQSSGSFSGNTISTPGNEGYVIAKYTNTGNLSWVNSYGTAYFSGYSNSPSLFVDNNNTVYTTGYANGSSSSPFKFNGNSVYSSDYFGGGFILKCNTSGNFQDIKFTGSPINTLLSTKNGIYGIGNFENNYNSFSSTKLTSKGLTDFFVCKLSSLSDLDVATPKLCMVSLDPITNKNKVVWEKPTTSNIDKFIIYRENVLEDDDSIGYQNYSGANYFIDNTTSPEKKAESYRIGVIDVCGNKSALSDDITTMHLMIYPGPNQKWSLLWNQYDDANYYRIYRGTSPTNKVVFDSIAAYDDILLYTDINSPSGSVFYAVEAVLDNNCGTSQGSMAGRARSNNAYYTAETMGLDNLQTLDAAIYPNPTKGIVSVQLTDKTSADNSTLTVINPLGQTVFTQQLIQTKTDVDLSNYPKGIYVLKVENDNHFSFHKLIVE